MNQVARARIRAGASVCRDVSGGLYALYSSWLIHRPVHAVLLAVQVVAVTGSVGSGFGISNLYWHEDFWVQLLAGATLGGFAMLVWWLALRLEDDPGVYSKAADRVLARVKWLRIPPSPDRTLLAFFIPFGLLLTVIALARSMSSESRLIDNVPLPTGAWLTCIGLLLVTRLRWCPQDKIGLRDTLIGLSVTAAAMAAGAWLIPVTAVMALTLTLTMFVWVVVALARRPIVSVLVLVLVVFAVGWLNGSDPYKLTYPGMDYDKKADVSPYQEVDVEIEVVFGEQVDPCTVNPPGGKASVNTDTYLIDDKTAIRAWRLASKSEKKPIMVVVATSGGGIAASYWTASCLSALEAACPEFPQRVRVVTGASGGMHGATVFVARLGDSPSPVGPGAMHDCGKESLTPVVRQLFLADLPSIFVPYTLRCDRGRALEAAWSTNTGGTTGRAFAELTEGEAAGQRPSLIFSPMVVEDGRQLLISNLDVSKLPGRSNQLFGLFPSSRKMLTLGTAIRMNAAFPYVSPATCLPTTPPIRVVDAGFRDNYGVEVAAAWLAHNSECIRENASGVLLLQIRTYPSVPANSSENAADRLSRGWEFMRSPMDGLTSVRLAAMEERNDKEISKLYKLFNGDEPSSFFSTITLEGGEEMNRIPLGWSLTSADRRRIDGMMSSAAIQKKITEVVDVVRK